MAPLTPVRSSYFSEQAFVQMTGGKGGGAHLSDKLQMEKSNGFQYEA